MYVHKNNTSLNAVQGALYKVFTSAVGFTKTTQRQAATERSQKRNTTVFAGRESSDPG